MDNLGLCASLMYGTDCIGEIRKKLGKKYLVWVSSGKLHIRPRTVRNEEIAARYLPECETIDGRD